ncbi:MAG: DegV family protein [Butyrivibrio sp.]
MNDSKIALVVDSGCDLSDSIIKRYNIKVLRLKIIADGKEYTDGLDFDPLSVYKMDELPKTSTPNMQEVLDLVEEIKSEGYEKIIAITISSGLSGTNNTIAMTFREIEDMETYVFDTKNISIGAGLFAIVAGRMIEKGKSFEEIVNTLEHKIKDSKVFFYMDTLENLRKGGRISPAVALVGKVLNLKPIISCNEEGTYYTVAKFRGAGKGLAKLFDEAMKFAGQHKCLIGLMNGGAPDVAATIRPRIEEAAPNGTIVVDKQITGTMAIHTGPGLLGIGVMLV